MRFIATQHAGDGARLATDVFGGRNPSMPLLRAGVALDTRYRQALIQAGIDTIVVDDEESEGIEITSPLSLETRIEATVKLTALFDRAQMAIARGKPLEYDAIHAAEQVAQLIANDVGDSPDTPVTLVDSFGAAGHRVQHPIDVTVLGLLIARRLFERRGRESVGGKRTTEGVDDALRRLSLGLLLHDIGTLTAPDATRVVDGNIVELSPAELRAHIDLGHASLPIRLISAHAAAVVLNHHERWNGSGSPGGLATDKIPQFARIAAVADVFDAVTSARPDIPAVSAHVGVSAVCRGAGNLFDPEVVEVFRSVVSAYPPGTPVTLSDGSSGLIAGFPTSKPNRQPIRLLRDPQGGRLAPTEISLSEGGPLTIAAASWPDRAHA